MATAAKVQVALPLVSYPAVPPEPLWEQLLDGSNLVIFAAG
jgi:hypothetical protein